MNDFWANTDQEKDVANEDTEEEEESEEEDSKHSSFDRDDKNDHEHPPREERKENASGADVNGNFSIDRVISFGAPGWIDRGSKSKHDSLNLNGLRVYSSGV